MITAVSRLKARFYEALKWVFPFKSFRLGTIMSRKKIRRVRFLVCPIRCNDCLDCRVSHVSDLEDGHREHWIFGIDHRRWFSMWCDVMYKLRLRTTNLVIKDMFGGDIGHQQCLEIKGLMLEAIISDNVSNDRVCVWFDCLGVDCRLAAIEWCSYNHKFVTIWSWVCGSVISWFAVPHPLFVSSSALS